MSDAAEKPVRHSLTVLPDARPADLLARAESRQPAQPRDAAPSIPASPPPAPLGSGSNAGSAGPIDAKAVEAKVIKALKTVYDPEIPVNIYDLGLIYAINVGPSGAVHIRMTLTAPACPVAESLPVEVTNRVQSIPEVSAANVEVVWDPPWTRDRMTDAAKLQLGML